MPDDTGDLGLAHGADLAVQPLTKVEAAGPELPSPTQVTNAMLPVLVAGKRREAPRGVADEAANCVGVQGEEKGDEQMVHVPKRFERLLPDAVVRRRVHQQHAEKHHMAGDAARLGIMDLQSRHGTNLRLLDIVEATGAVSGGLRSDRRCHLLHIMCRGVDGGEQQHRVGELSVHPYVLIERDEPDLGPEEPHDGPADGEQDEHPVDAQD